MLKKFIKKMIATVLTGALMVSVFVGSGVEVKAASPYGVVEVKDLEEAQKKAISSSAFIRIQNDADFLKNVREYMDSKKNEHILVYIPNKDNPNNNLEIGFVVDGNTAKKIA